MSSALANKPSLVESPKSGKRYLIIDAPTDANIHRYLSVLQLHNVKHVVRVCDPTYETETFSKADIKVLDLPFVDGDPPPEPVIQKWLSLVDETFTDPANPTKASIAVHCVAGLGRAPVMVAISLIEDGMDALDAVEFVRSKRRGAINNKQLRFLETYKPRSRPSGCCTIL